MVKKIFLLLILTASFIYSQVNNDANNRFMLAQSYAQSGELQKAKNILNELYNSNPANPQFFQALNDVLIRLKEYDSSAELIEKHIAVTPQDINLYGLLGSTYYLNNNDQKAFSIWDEALQKLPQNSVNYRVIANYAIERRAFDKAIEILKKGKTFAEDPNMFSYDLANLYSLTMGYKEAAEEYCSILAANPNQLTAIESRIFSYINKPGALEQAISVFENCKQENQVSYIYLLARLYTEQKSYDKAYSYYQDLDSRQGNQGAELFNFAQMIYNEGEYKIASGIFNDIIEQYPESPFTSMAKLGYARTMEAMVLNENPSGSVSWKPFYNIVPLSAGKVDEVIGAYRELISLYSHTDAGNEALFRIGVLLFHNENKFGEAKDYFLKIINEAPMSTFAASAAEELASILILEGNLDEAQNYLEKVPVSRPDPEKKNSASLKLANIYFYKGDFTRAKEILSGILDNLKDNTANDAIELSLLLNTTMNDSSNLLVLAQAELLAEQKKFDQAKEKYQQIVQNPRGFMISHLAKIRVAEMELAMDRYETSVDLFSRIAEENEKNIYADKALYLLGRIYEYGLNNPVRAVEIYESLLAKFPNSLYLDEARESILNLRNKAS